MPVVTRLAIQPSGSAVRFAAVVLAGCTALVVAYRLVLPLFGVLSPVTWSTIWVAWLWVIGMPARLAATSAAKRAWHWAAIGGALAAFAVIGLSLIGPPSLDPGSQFRRHRPEFARLAGDYRAGRITGDVRLPWPYRSLSVDGQAHHRCGLTDQNGRKNCALFLLAAESWRAEVGVGFAYYPVAPGPDASISASISTAAGDSGVPTRELGGGWWWVE
jgi:hypothetical protein